MPKLVDFVRFCVVLGLCGWVRTAPSSESEGYVSVPGVGSYKLHLVNKPYIEGAQICESEDAHLAIINSKQEEDVLATLLRGTTKDAAFIGVNDIAIEGQMVTVLGEIFADVGFFNWGDNEPNNADSSEDCVSMDRNRILNDLKCGHRLSFFCEKKTASDSEAIGTMGFATFSDGYVTLPGLGSYRLHPEQAPYSDAAQQCENEDAHLAIANSKREEEALVDLLRGSYEARAFIGVNDLAFEGHMVTVLGTPLSSNPVSKFAENEPNDYLGTEDCVTIGKDSLMNDQDCGKRESFICEKYPPNRKAVAEGGYVSVPGVGSYMLHEYSLSYSAAAQVCETEQAHLAVVNSKAEEDVLMNLLHGSRYSLSAFVGINDITEEGRWVTVLDEVWSRVGFSKWREGEPNDADGSEDCVTVGLDRLMTARRCTEQFAYFCEKKKKGATNSPGSSLRHTQASGIYSQPGYGSYLNVPGVGSYKFYRDSKYYSEAALVCENENAHLAVINSKAEEDVLTDLINRSDRFLAFVGVNDIAVEGQMVTVLGDLWSDVGFTKWRDGEPNDMEGAEDCGVFRGDRLIEDGRCGYGHSFFCEKNTATHNQGSTFAASFSAGYITLPGVGSYRLHEDIAPYSEAARVCASEGAYLVVINSKVEEDAIVNIFLNTYQGNIYIGVNDLAVEGFMVTALGDPLASASFPQWSNSEPNDDFGIEDCVVLSRDRLMNDQECGIRFGFMCEKKSGSSSMQQVSSRSKVAEGGYVTVHGLGSYMLHEYNLPYSAAARVCETEQAHLAIINSKAEEDVLMNLLYGSRLSSAYVGVNDMAREGRMVTVQGDLWSRVGFSAWREGEPNDPDGTFDCVSIDTSRLLSGEKCTHRLPYFCEKSSGNASNQGVSASYVKTSVGSYKLYVEARSYSDAEQLCESEGAHLAVVNTKREEDAVIRLLQASRKSFVYVGVNDIAVEGKMVTVLGDLLVGTGYFKWANGEPKNRNGLEDCATLHKDRQMRVRECGDHASFICEKKNGCPSLPHEPSLEMECTLNGVVVNCATKAEPGTVAAMSCARGYVHKSHKKFFSTTCLANSHKWSAPLPMCEMDCGRSGTGAQAFATRGKLVEQGELPWHVGIFKQEAGGTFNQWCGGTLISPTLIVSAAHCFWNETNGHKTESSLFRVAAGKISRTWETPETETQQRTVAEIIMPVRFSGKINNYQSDIAIVRLSQRVDITLSVNVACIDWNEAIASLVARTNGTVAGWGLNEDGIRSPMLTAVQMAYVPYQECWNMFLTKNPNFRKFITSDKLCAGWTDRGTTVCPGDSGGGLLFPKATATGLRYFLRGIVSVGPSATGGTRCNADSIAAFTDIAAHSNFFDVNVRR